jgi:formate hydrogenlyase transcriptional activator
MSVPQSTPFPVPSDKGQEKKGGPASKLTQMESLWLAERHTLEMITGGASLIEILQDLCAAIDAQDPEIISTILLTDPDGKRLWPKAGPKVPKDWTERISPLPISPQVGSCGAAAYLKKLVIVSDIAGDSLFDGYREAALSNGLRSAWSQPLISKGDEVLGTFAMYYATPRTPGEGDLELIRGASHIALIAIECERSQTALRDVVERLRWNERELQMIVDAIPQGVHVMDSKGHVLYANKTSLEYMGIACADLRSDDFRARVFHPDDFQSMIQEREKLLASGLPFEMEQRVRRKDGQYRWFFIQYNPLRDAEGQVIRWYATGTDIQDRKQAEERMQTENLALREDIDRSSMFEEIVGSSKPLRQLLSQIRRVAPTDSTVLIFGETGTGKELVARAIHKRSHRSSRAFIRVNCAAIPSSLVASELFGHEKGAFTGALQRRLGRFEAADGGTIFLDEIGELPTETQLALLRVLQEREFERLGNSQPIRVDVRVLAATNRDLKAAVAAGGFRKDLFYRLNVFSIQVPTLRQRADDIPLLVQYLIERFAKKAGKKIRRIDKKTLKLFQAYDWPGNIRELQNVVERAVILSDGETFSVDETWLLRDTSMVHGRAVPLEASVAGRERQLIEAALAECRGRISGPDGAAARLGIPRQTLDYKIKSLEINKHHFKVN